MSFYEKLRRHQKLFLSSTGMTVESFERLYPLMEEKHSNLEELRKSKTVVTGSHRKREVGGGRPYENDLRDRIVMVLMYYRLYLTQEFMTLLFQARHKSVICRSIQSVKALVEMCLPTPEKVKKASQELAQKETSRRKRIGTLEEFLEAYPELEILIDGKEQPKRRPKDEKKKKSQYSGKKKRHTLKQLIGSTRGGFIIYQGNHFDGSTHDFAAFKDEREQIFSGFEGLKVSGYFDKKTNRLRGSIRVGVEHAIGKTKKYRIASEVYRNSDESYDSTLNIVSGLVNLRRISRIHHKQGVYFQW